MIDVREGKGCPRSGRRRIGEFMWLLRVSDKARASAAETGDGYIYPCPIDRGMMERWGIATATFGEAVAEHGDDEALYAWLRARVSDEAIDRANTWLVETWRENLDRQDLEERGEPLAASTPICANCGVAFSPDRPLPPSCPICDDERVSRPKVQAWTTTGELAAAHGCEIRSCEPGMLAGIGVTPNFAIGQRAMLVEQSDGCILWDCVSLVDRQAVEYVNARGGLNAIAISHPHFYGAMAQWSVAFGGVPVYVHEADRQWVVHAPRSIAFWSGDTIGIAPGVTLVRCGGHFDGGTAMHVASAASGRGALLTGDVVMVTQYGGGVSFMRSYPTYVPLRAADVAHIRSVLEPFPFEAIYGYAWDRVIESGGRAIVAQTAQRYMELATTSFTHPEYHTNARLAIGGY